MIYKALIVFVCGFLIHQNYVFAVRILPKHLLYFRILVIGLLWYALWLYLILPAFLEINYLHQLLTSWIEWVGNKMSLSDEVSLDKGQFLSLSALAIPSAFFMFFQILHRIRREQYGEAYIIKLYSKILSKSETPLKQKCLDYYQNKKPFLISLENEKFYIGVIAKIPPIYGKLDSIVIIPLLIGYIDKQNKIQITTDYDPILPVEKLQNKNEAPTIIIKADRIISIQDFSLDVYLEHFISRLSKQDKHASDDHDK